MIIHVHSMLKGLSKFDPPQPRAVAWRRKIVPQVQLWSGQVQLKNLELDVPNPRVGGGDPSVGELLA